MDTQTPPETPKPGRKNDKSDKAEAPPVDPPVSDPAVSTTADEPVAADPKSVESGPVEVTLVHPDHGATVKVNKPSADYTNYVRGYGYKENA